MSPVLVRFFLSPSAGLKREGKRETGASFDGSPSPTRCRRCR